MKSLTLFISVFVFSIHAWAYSCKQSDKLEDLRPYLSPLRDQDSIGWCYAFTASDLLTDYLRRNRDQIPKNISRDLDFTKTENTVSPLSGAFAMEAGKPEGAIDNLHHMDESLKNYEEVLELNHKIAKNEEQLVDLCGNGGCLLDCIDNNSKSEICEEWLKTHDVKKINQINDEKKFLIARRKMYYWAYAKGLIQGGRTDRITEYYLTNGFSFEKQISSEDIRNGDKLSKLNRMMLEAYMKAKTKDEAICNGFNVIKQICASCENLYDQIKPALEAGFDWNNSPFHEFVNLEGIKHKIKNPTKPKVIVVPNSISGDTRKRINQYLRKGQIVGISFEMKDIVSLDSGNHASSIVGRACVEGREHFILRNSWGDHACDETKKSMTLKKIEIITNRINYKNTKVTQEDKHKYIHFSGYNACLHQCQSIKEPDEKDENFSSIIEPRKMEEINRKKLEKSECENACYQKSKSTLSNAVETFECDEGYYLIRSEKLLGSINDIKVIE